MTAARVDTTTWKPVPGTRTRYPLRSDGTADEIIATIAECARTLGELRGSPLAVAMPGPFDYEAGIGRFVGVKKFDALNNVDVGARLSHALGGAPSRIVFLNDAAAFGIGEWVPRRTRGDDNGHHRLVAVTLGTGVGSAFIEAGTPINRGPRVPPEGYAHLLRVDGQLLEDVMSTRAIVAAYVEHAGPPTEGAVLDVRLIAGRASGGDGAAVRALADAGRALGAALAPWLVSFAADTLVVGGGIAHAWSFVGPPLRAGIEEAARHPERIAIVKSRDPESSIEIGAAWFAHTWVLPHAAG